MWSANVARRDAPACPYVNRLSVELHTCCKFPLSRNAVRSLEPGNASVTSHLFQIRPVIDRYCERGNALRARWHELDVEFNEDQGNPVYKYWPEGQKVLCRHVIIDDLLEGGGRRKSVQYELTRRGF